MATRVFTISFHIPGTLSANVTPVWTAPFDCQLIHVSATATNNSDATLSIGTVASAAAYLAASTIGDSSDPAEFDRDNFVGSQFPHIAKGTDVMLTLDYDGSAGTAAQNVTIVLTFTEG